MVYPRTEKPAIILIGINSLPGIQAVRLFSRRNVPVIGLTDDLRHPYSRTRLCERIIEADVKGEGWVHQLVRMAPELPGRPLLLPCQDMPVLHLSRHRDLLAPHYRFLLPARDTVETLVRKEDFYGLAEKLGIPSPRTVYLREAADVETAVRTLPFPCLLKPSTRNAAWQQLTHLKVIEIPDPESLRREYLRYRNAADCLIAQEWIQGPETGLYSVNCLFDRHCNPQATFVARKIRQWPPDGGSSSMGEECRRDDVLETALDLFRQVGFQGLGYIEMKEEAATGKCYVMEANIGRPTGRGFIAEIGSVELHYAWYCEVAGLPLPPGLAQQYQGVKWIYLRQDLQAVAHGLLNGRTSLRQVLASWRGRTRSALWCWQDPMPFLLDFWRAASLALLPGGRKTRKRLTHPAQSYSHAE